MHPLVHIGNLCLSGYWLMSVCGIAAAVLYVALTSRNGNIGHIEWYHIWTIFCIAMTTVFIGGKIAGMLVNIPEIIENWAAYKSDPAKLWRVLSDGRSFYGGFLLMVALLWLYCRRNNLPLDMMGAILTPSIPLFMVFGRMGCFLGGCCYGVPAPWGVVFPEGSLAPAGVPMFPSQLAEAAGQLLLFIALALFARRDTRKWLVFPLYLGGYAVLRFILEFWRGDPERGVWILSVAQWTSIALLAAAALIVWRHDFTSRGARV